jgi:signal transduction histidine kinase
MTVIWAAVLGVIAILGGVAIGMVREEVRARVERLPYSIVRLAGRRLPTSLRQDCTDEWLAELQFIVRHTNGLPVSQLMRGISFAVSLLLVGAPTVGRELTNVEHDVQIAGALEGLQEAEQLNEQLLAALNSERAATDRLAAALERERAAAEHLRTLDELRSGFLQAVSHDLRTPLASVLGIALTLERGRGKLESADTDALLGRLTGNARKLDRILTGLLDLDRLDRGIVELRDQPVDLARLVAAVVSDARDELLDGHPVHLDLLPVQIPADAVKVERIVENLLANAARHTDLGTPIWVRVEPCEQGALLCVDDAGPGILAEHRESIFQPFQRGRSVGSHAPGSGVGLALVAQFANLHGGRAWVEARLGGGSSFRVFLCGQHPNGE